MKSILIVTDFSSASKSNLDRVLRLLEQEPNPCEVVLLNTYMVQSTDPDRVIALNDELKKRSCANLEKERQTLLRWLPPGGHIVRIASHIGSVQHVIQHMLKKQNFDLVILGSHLGVTEELIKDLVHGRCLVMVEGDETDAGPVLMPAMLRSHA
jgi:hypothetical protein